MTFTIPAWLIWGLGLVFGSVLIFCLFALAIVGALFLWCSKELSPFRR